jgi:hypothetical protein
MRCVAAKFVPGLSADEQKQTMSQIVSQELFDRSNADENR